MSLIAGVLVGLLGAIVTQVLHMALMLAAAPALTGLVTWLRARLVGRSGARIGQPYRDLFRALRRQPLVGEDASAVFRSAPALCFAAIAAAAFLVPSFALGMAFAPVADLLVIAGLLALARCTLALAAMDVGTAFGGIGASRQMAFAATAEPALLLVILTLSLLAGTTNLDVIARLTQDGALTQEGVLGPLVSLLLALFATVAVAIVDTGRLPADDFAARQEPAMIFGAQVLEFSGWHLAVIEAAAALKLLLWLSLIAAMFLPFGIAPTGAGPFAWTLGLLAWAAKMLALACALAVFESAIARMPVFRLAEFLGIAVLLALLAAGFLFVSQGFAA